jgi:hypothetical protein
MHVLQWIAVQADDKDQAFRSVKDYLETAMGSEYSYASWYDWFVTGGGRWNPNPDSQYNDDDQSMVLSYETDPDLFEERVLQSMESRKREFDDYAKDVNPDILAKIISDYNPRDKMFAAFSEMYPIKKIIDMAYGEWDYNSYFFDCHHDSTTPAYMFESIDNGTKNWYIVPVDFHF